MNRQGTDAAGCAVRLVDGRRFRPDPGWEELLDKEAR